MANVNLEEALKYTEESAKRSGVDPQIARSLLMAENFSDEGVTKAVQNPKGFSLDTERVSPKGARGLMQVMPATHKALQEQGFLPEGHSLDSWQSQIDAGISAIKEIVKRTGATDLQTVAADYNAGPRGSKAVAEEGNLPAETTNYLTKVGIAHTAFSAPAAASQRDVRLSDMEGTDAGVPTPNAAPSVQETAGATALMDILKESNVWIDRSIAAVTKSSDEEAAAKREEADQILKAGQARGRAEEAKGMIEAAAVRTKERILQITGLDTREADSRIARNVAEFDRVDASRRVLEREINQRMKVGILDNPIEWFVNQTILPGQVEDHNAMARVQGNLIHQTRAMQEAASNQEAIDIAATADQIGAYRSAIANADVADATAKAATARAEAASAVARKAAGIATLVDKKFDNTAKVIHWQDLLDKISEGRQLKADQAEELRQLDIKVKRLGAVIGAPDISNLTLKEMTAQDRTMFLNRVGKGTAGDDFYEALTFISKFGNVQTLNATGSAEFASMLRKFQGDVKDAANTEGMKVIASGGKVPPREELLRSAANDMESTWFAVRQNMLVAKAGNPYLVDHGATVVGWRGDEKNPIYAAVSTAYKARVRMTDQQVFSTAVEKVLDGSLTPVAASRALAEYYAAAVRRNNVARSYKLIGLSPQDDYNILPRESRMGVNMMDAGMVENVLTEIRARHASAMRGGFGAEIAGIGAAP